MTKHSDRVRVIHQGRWGSVCAVVLKDGSCPAQEFLDTLDRSARAKMLAVIEYLASQGVVNNIEKMRKIVLSGPAVFELKISSGPGYRMYGAYRGQRFLLTHGGAKPRSNTLVAEEAKRSRGMIEDWES